MRASLQQWINDADNARHLRHFQVPQLPIELARIDNRLDDYYISLVGELFRNLHAPQVPSADWAKLGNAFLQISIETTQELLHDRGISKDEAALFASAAFYFGDFPASACLAMRLSDRPKDADGLRAACFDFLVRPPTLQSNLAREIQNALKAGAGDLLDRFVMMAMEWERAALKEGPEAWIVGRLMSHLIARFRETNVRAVLPNGWRDFWDQLVKSLVDRQPSTWEFFPSQIEAIHKGLLDNNDSYAMQMPTGAGKTTLCETLLYWHLKTHPADAAILLVPYRSLASELRGTLVRRLNKMGLASRCAYGGTVPTGDEIHGLGQVRAMIATPESLSGILSADLAFAQRVSLVICDEGHLLDGGGRGIGLELLLARMKSRAQIPPRFVFVSAIVPNIEEINSWLGGNDQTVIRSNYRPAIAEYAFLEQVGTGANASVSLVMHPHEAQERQFTIDHFLTRNSFTFRNPRTGRPNTYGFRSIKTQAVAAARKLLPMGTTAIFAANKRGHQGAVGLAEDLVEQLMQPLPLPAPLAFAKHDALQRCIAYLEGEYGDAWIGTLIVRQGAVLHHGDIPQEAREVLEGLIRDAAVRLVICTSTLAEGINLPIRSLVLYSVQRQSRAGRADPMLTRDIKNLVGRAGRAGANTKGLVICANPMQWHLVRHVAMEEAGEAVRGSLRELIDQLSTFLMQRGIALNNDLLENINAVCPVTDGVDSTLIDLITEEIGEEAFVAHARLLADQTFAVRLLPQGQADLLRYVFELRARRLIGLRHTGQLAWVRETGAKVRMLVSVERDLWPARERWQDPVDPLDEELCNAILEWAWTHDDLLYVIIQTFRPEGGDPVRAKKTFFEVVRRWMMGASFLGISRELNMDMDTLLAVHARVIAFTLQTLVEQGISLITQRLKADGIEIAAGVTGFTEQLRFGAPNLPARVLAASGVRHRKAYVALGNAIVQAGQVLDLTAIRTKARESLLQSADGWRAFLGELVYANTLQDLS